MTTIYDYLKYYNNIPFEESRFNDIDNLIFSILVYLPLKNIMNENTYSIQKIYEKLNQSPDKNKARSLSGVAVEILKVIVEGKRYKNVTFSNYANIVDDKTQFNALTFRFGKNECYIAFKGTDNSLSGWKENFELSYKYPVIAQTLAADYLKQNVKFTDKIVYVGGHSKGGNLAMASVMETDKKTYNKIKTIFNNDGPGFLKEQFDSDKYQNIAKKLKNFVPEESTVGILLLNDNYTYIKSSAKGIMQHNPATWNCFGPFLINGKLSTPSIKIQQQLNSWNEKNSSENKELMINKIFDILKESGVEYFYQLKNIKYTQLITMINDAKEIDEESKMILTNMLKGLFIKEKKE